MKFTFGIITDGANENNLSLVVDSIKKQNIPFYEIIIVGKSNIIVDKNIQFDESIKDKWITKKKNLITESAKYENIVYMHDYVVLNKEWYLGFKKFGNMFDVCMTRILNLDGTRFRDWCIHDPSPLGNSYTGIIPYDIVHLSKYMYFSGTYWVAKKQVMEEFKLDETLCWGQSEDIVWSKQITSKYDFSMNTFSTVSLLKQKDLVVKDYSQGHFY